MTQYCANPNCSGRKRDGVAPEFMDYVSACVDCQGPLMRGSAPDDVHEKPRFTDYETIFLASNPVQAHVVRGLIEAEGIVVYLKGEVLSSALGELPVTVQQVEVQVPVEYALRGREIVGLFEGSQG